MKHFLYVGCLAFASSLTASAQTIEVPVGTPLTVQGNLNLPTGFSFLLNSQTYIKAPAAGNGSVYFGFDAGMAGGGLNVTSLGHNAGKVNTGNNNVFVGTLAGVANTSGVNNVFVGSLAGQNNNSGVANLFLGTLAGSGNTTGSYNLFMGNGGGQGTTTGAGNTFIGDGAGGANTTGSNNTFIGRAAGGGGFTNVNGQNNTYIGFQARAGANSIDGATAIGVNAIVSASNAIAIGAPGAKVGIGNGAPANTLEITNGTANMSGLRFTNLTSASPATLLTQTKFLAVNASGDVVLASSTGSAREGVAESFWQRKGSFLQSTQDDAVIIGSTTRTPAGYKLFVEQGILTEKVKVALKNTSDWSDYVFQSDYKLKSLSEVESFIQANKHLPGVPSAQEMVDKGNDLHKTDAKLLEKIEELTLYSIQQQKEIDQLKQLVKQMLEKK